MSKKQEERKKEPTLNDEEKSINWKDEFKKKIP